MNKNALALAVLACMLILPSVSADTFYTYRNSTDNGFPIDRTAGVLYVPNATVSLYNFTYNATVGTSTICYVYNHTGAADNACLASSTFMASAAISGGVCTFPTPVTLPAGGTYALLAGDVINTTDTHTMPWGSNIGFPVLTSWGNVTKAKQMIVGGSPGTNCYTATAAGQYFFGAFTVGIADSPNASILTLQVKDVVTGSAINSFCAEFTTNNASNTSFNMCNFTGSSIYTNQTFTSGNITFFNITAGNTTPVYFNTTNTSVSFTSTQSVTGFTHQALIGVRAYTLYTNTSIGTFNVTNGQVSNTTGSAPVFIRATNGTNTLTVSVPGNISKSVSCVVPAPLASYECNATDIYDSVLAVRFTNAWSGNNVSNFTTTLTHSSGVIAIFNTTNGTAYLPAIRGNYTLYAEADGYSITADNYANVTVNAANVNHTFAIYSNNSIRTYIYRQSDGTPILENITVEIIGNASYASNTTTSGVSFTENLRDGVYTVRLSGTNWTTNSYTVTVSDRSTQRLNAYLTANTSTVLFNVEDYESAASITGASIGMYRFVNGSLVLVESHLTDIAGNAQFNYLSGVVYQFIVSATGYTTSTFTLDPIIFSSYDIKLRRASTDTPGIIDYSGVSIYYSPKNYFTNETNDYSITFYSPNGTFTDYNTTVLYPGGSFADSGTSSGGEVFTHSFNLTTATFNDFVNVTYCYATVTGPERCFSYKHQIIGAYASSTLQAMRDNAYGLGLLERVLIVTFTLIVVAGILTVTAGVIAGGVGGLFVLVVFIGTGFLPIWVGVLSLVVGFFIIVKGGGL